MKNSERIIKRIREERIRPVPAWQIKLRKQFLRISFVIFILFGAISFSVILYAVQQSEFQLLHHLNHSFMEFFLALFPVLWLSILIVFLTASIISAKRSGKGYKLSFGKWLVLSTALSVTLGTLFFIAGGASWFENRFANQLEIYESVQEKKISVWSQPENGTLSGEIITSKDERIQLRDFAGKTWDVDIEHAGISGRLWLESGEIIRLSGQMTSAGHFRADQIRPWGGNRPGGHPRQGKGPGK